MLLAARKQVIALTDLSEEVLWQRVDLLVHLDFSKNGIDLRVGALLLRVQVLANRTLQQERALRYERDLLPQSVQADRLDVDAVDQSAPTLEFNQSEEGVQDGAFA